MYGIYELKFEDNSYYIGLSKSVATRFSQHLNLMEKGTHHNKNLQAAFSQYGAPSFKVLEQCSNTDDLDAIETKYIKMYLKEGRVLLNIAKVPLIRSTLTAGKLIPEVKINAFSDKVKSLVILHAINKATEELILAEIEVVKLRNKIEQYESLLDEFGVVLEDEELEAIEQLDLVDCFRNV